MPTPKGPHFLHIIAAIILFFACSDGVDRVRDNSDGDEETADGDAESDEEASGLLHQFQDWNCPEKWRQTPAFINENGEENPPEGIAQFSICEPPVSWVGPSGPADLKSWECPEHWLAVQHEELSDETGSRFHWCEPPPLPEDCPLGEFATPGDTACRPIGDPCPTDDWPEGLPNEVEIRYVKAGATGGEGTRSHPHGTINEALENPQDGMVLAVAKGRYIEAVTLNGPYTIWGACTKEVVIEAPSSSQIDPTLSLGGRGGSVVRNLTLTGDRIAVRAGASQNESTLQYVEIFEAQGKGIRGVNANLQLEDVTIIWTRPWSDGSGGRGIDAYDASSIRATGLVIADNREAGVFAWGSNTSIRFSESAVLNTWSQQTDSRLGRGISIDDAAEFTADRLLVSGNRDVAVYASTGAVLDLTNVVIRDTQYDENDKTWGRGLMLNEGAQVTAENLLLSNNRNSGLFATDADTKVTLLDAVIRDTQSDASDDTGGTGIFILEGCEFSASRVLADRNGYIGIMVSKAGAEIHLTDGVVRDTESQKSDDKGGLGIAVLDGARLTGTRLTLDGNRYIGVMASDPGTVIDVSDTLIRGTLGHDKDKKGGIGLVTVLGADFVGKRLIFDENRYMGVLASDSGTTLNLSDAVIRNTDSRENDGEFGRGIGLQTEAGMYGERLLVAGNKGAGVVAFSGSSIEISDAVFRHTELEACEKLPVTDPDRCVPVGINPVSNELGAYCGGSISLQRFLVTGESTLGVQIAIGASRDSNDQLQACSEGGSMHFVDGMVSGFEIGVNIQVPGYDNRTLQNNVLYYNRRNLESEELPVPDPNEALEGI